ncbi:site-2 protease family protein [Sphingomonas sp. LT1P40]|uniref:site-2 protease family protein n=1 Tax=Alteristakelama amylovorans TaxID=3096166 RepID=UPI002FC73DF1
MEAAFYTVATWLLPVVAAIVLHDFAQWTVARWMGDPAANAQRPERNAVRHIDAIGSVLVPIALALAHAPVFGWGKRLPLTVDDDTVTRRRLALVALTGPVACMVHAVIGAVALGALVAAMGGTMPESGTSGFLAANLLNFILANACMATFHLLPFPPFDVGRAIAELLPEGVRRKVRRGGRIFILITVAVIVALPLLDPEARIGEKLAAPVINAIMGFVLGLVNLTV